MLPQAGRDLVIHDEYLEQANDRYRAAYPKLAKAVKRHFRNAKPVVQFGMPGWIAKRPKRALDPSYKGTFDPTVVFIGFVERKSGLTLHLWHPGGLGVAASRKAALAKAGVKPGVGCFVYSRKGEYPIDAIEALIEGAAALDG